MAFKLFDRVQEVTSSTGTGDLTLSGAVTGFKTFASRYSTGDTLYYGVHAVNASGVPTGDWEIGLGTYSAANTLTRTTVLASSNSDAAVNFAAGNKRAFVTLTALQGGFIREKLSAARTYYVRTDGSDSNNGLANTSGGAFLTIQKAVDVISSTLDISAGIVPTIQVADGTYTGAVVMKNMVGDGNLTIQGNSGTPANVVISVTSNHCFYSGVANAPLTIKDLKMTTTTSGSCLLAAYGGTINYSNVDFGSCAGQHAYSWSGSITATGNYTISGGASSHFTANNGGQIACESRTKTITGTPAFSTAFAVAGSGGGILDYSGTHSGSATGSRYYAYLNGAINTLSGGANYFPGNSAGTTATGGQYV